MLKRIISASDAREVPSEHETVRRPLQIDIGGALLRDVSVLAEKGNGALARHAQSELRELSSSLRNNDWLTILALARSLAVISSSIPEANDLEDRA